MKGLNYFRQKIVEFEKSTPTPKADFYREYTTFIIDKMKSVQYTDSENKTHDVDAFFANPERAIAKIKEDRNLKLPLVSVGIDDIDEDSERRRASHNIEISTVWDTKERRAVRVISRASKPINLSFTINIWAKYVEDMNQLVENIALLFNPSLDFETSQSTNTKAFITQITDGSVMSSPDREDRVVRKLITVTAEAYLSYPKYVVTQTGEIETMTADFEFVDYPDSNYRSVMSLKGNSGFNLEHQFPDIDRRNPLPTVDDPHAGSTPYLNNEVRLSDGFTMLYNVFVPNASGGPHPLVIATPGTGNYRHSSAYTPSPGFLRNSKNPRTENYGEQLLAAGFAYAIYDVRAQSTPWDPKGGGGGLDSSLYYQPNLIPSGDISVPWEEFGSENFAVRELLDVFEIKDHVASGSNPWLSNIDGSAVGHIGGSLGGMAGGFAAIYSGKSVPLTGIDESTKDFITAGAGAYGFETDWGYTAESKFSSFQAVHIESFFGRWQVFRNGTPPTRFGFLTGPIRMYDLTVTAPRHLSLYESAIVSGSMNGYITEMERRCPIDSNLSSTVVPANMAFSYDDRQRGIDNWIDTFESYGSGTSAPKKFFGCTGHHGSPKNKGVQKIIETEAMDWFKYYLKGDTSITLRDKTYKFMESPSGIDDYRDIDHTRTFHDMNYVSSVNVSSIGYALTLGFGFDELLYTGTSSVDVVSGTTDGDFRLKYQPQIDTFEVGNTGTKRSITSTSDLIEWIKYERGEGSLYSGTEFKKRLQGGSKINQGMFAFIAPSATADYIIFGSASGSFKIDSPSAGLFSFDLYDLQPGMNPRLITTGSQAFDFPVSATQVSVVSRFQCYRLNMGHQLAVVIKNHSLFTPDIEDPTRTNTFEICPYFNRNRFTFDLENSGCSVRVPMKYY